MNDLRSKILKLLRLAKFGKGHEAEAARSHAERLMKKHKLEVTLDEHDNGGLVEEEFPLDGEFWRENLLTALAAAYRCELRTPQWKMKDLPESLLIGRPEDVADVRVLYHRIWREIEREKARTWRLFLDSLRTSGLTANYIMQFAERVWFQTFTIEAMYVLTEQRLRPPVRPAAHDGGGPMDLPPPLQQQSAEIVAANKLADDILKLARYIGEHMAQLLHQRAQATGAACAWAIDINLPHRLKGLLPGRVALPARRRAPPQTLLLQSMMGMMDATDDTASSEDAPPRRRGPRARKKR